LFPGKYADPKNLSAAHRFFLEAISRYARKAMEDLRGDVFPVPLVRATAYLERVKGVFRLDFSTRSPETDAICLRFLNFMIQPPLYDNPRLWQPASGQPFYCKEPCRRERRVCQYRGFAVRAVITPEGGIGLCVDVKHAYAAEAPLPARIVRREFRRWHGHSCIYHLGHKWYKIRLEDLSDLNVSEELIERDGTRVTLLQWVADDCTRPIPPDLAKLPHDAAVVHYRNNQGETRAAPAGLCYPVLATDDRRAQSLQRQTILQPQERRARIHSFVREHLQDLRFGDVRLRLGQRPVCVRPRMFSVPDLLFGSGRVLSVRGTDGADQVGLDQLGRARLALRRVSPGQRRRRVPVRHRPGLPPARDRQPLARAARRGAPSPYSLPGGPVCTDGPRLDQAGGLHTRPHYHKTERPPPG
jgi:hypothetical protein